MKESGDKCLDYELWHACAGGMVRMPRVNSKVFYFPQGHAEHSLASVDFGPSPRIPPMILCRVGAVKYLADKETDEVYAKIRLIPVRNGEVALDEDGDWRRNGSEPNEKPTSFSKTLTQSDANNGGGFSVPRYCAETIFPRLDYNADPPVQNVIARDVHGETWKFRHIYRGTPRRHLLTTGWSTFVNQKRLVAGDSIVFLRVENGDLCVGIRRVKRVVAGGRNEPSSVWNCGSAANFGGFSSFLIGEENKMTQRNSNNGCPNARGRVGPESVVESAFLAANGQPFEIVYYPRASTPDFFVEAASVTAAMRIQWCSGMRFKMAFEAEDSARISWFMGTIGSVQVADPVSWPNSPWRLLQVKWDEPDLLQNAKCVNPWLVELISNMPVLRLSPFSPPRKKLCLPHHLDFPFPGHLPLPSFSGNPLSLSSPFCRPSNGSSAGIQGARHTQIGVPLPDLHLSKIPVGSFPVLIPRLDQQAEFPSKISASSMDGDENISCLLSMGNSDQKSDTKTSARKPLFLLFGQPILTEQCICAEISQSFDLDRKDLTKSYSSDQICTPKPDSCRHCEVFLDTEDVGQTFDVSVLGSYEELFQKLEDMFGIKTSEMTSHVCYHDATGAAKLAGDEPFSEFIKTARRLTILTKPSGSTAERKSLSGLQRGKGGLDSSNQTGQLSIIFA